MEPGLLCASSDFGGFQYDMSSRTCVFQLGFSNRKSMPTCFFTRTVWNTRVHRDRRKTVTETNRYATSLLCWLYARFEICGKLLFLWFFTFCSPCLDITKSFMLSALHFLLWFFFPMGEKMHNGDESTSTPDADSPWPDPPKTNPQPVSLNCCSNTTPLCRIMQLWWYLRKSYCIRKGIRYIHNFTNTNAENGTAVESQSPACERAWIYWKMEISNFLILLLCCPFSNQNQPSFVSLLVPS